jgi:hypothetical protein
MRKARLETLKSAVRTEIARAKTAYHKGHKIALVVADDGNQLGPVSLSELDIMTHAFPDGEYVRGREVWECDGVTGEAKHLLLTL